MKSMRKINKKIVCLGGGIGTVNVVKGLKNYISDVTVAISMADEGGSAGRLRRLYNIFPPGDIVSCMAAIGGQIDPLISEVLTYRFPGDRYAKDENLAGHKLGNLILVAMRDVTGDFEKAVALFQKTFHIPGQFLSATSDPVRISIRTKSGEQVFGEETIDLGKYDWQTGIEEVMLHPKDVIANPKLLAELKNANAIVAGPGDLYTTILPVLIIPGIKKRLEESKAKKIFIVNITNKPYETRDYTVSDYVHAIKKHLGFFPFTHVVVNNNTSVEIPKNYNYKYVVVDRVSGTSTQLLKGDFVDEKFPLYHSPYKLAKVIIEQL